MHPLRMNGIKRTIDRRLGADLQLDSYHLHQNFT